MAKKSDKQQEDMPLPPTKGLAFLVGLTLFSLVFCPVTVFLFFNLEIYQKLQISIFNTFTMGCLFGVVIAIIPALVFMRATMKKIKY